MAGLVDLKYTRAEAKEEADETMPGGSGPEYPWGLQIRLEDEELAKLGLAGGKMPEVGSELHLGVVAEVTGCSTQTMADGETDTCVTLQITMAEVLDAGSAAEEKSERETPKAEAKEMKPGKSLLARYAPATT